MPTICLASSKGGCGKSTAAALLSTELAKGTTVTLIDADPNQPLARWAARHGKIDNLSVVGGVTEKTIIDAIEGAGRQSAFVVVDLEGTASVMVSYAISRADLVVVPSQGSQLDAAEGVKTIGLIKQHERAFNRVIPFAVLLTRTNAALKPRTLKFIVSELTEAGIPVFNTQILEREAFRALFSYGVTLASLQSDQASNLASAKTNARAFAAEVVSMLKVKRKAA